MCAYHDHRAQLSNTTRRRTVLIIFPPNVQRFLSHLARSRSDGRGTERRQLSAEQCNFDDKHDRTHLFARQRLKTQFDQSEMLKDAQTATTAAAAAAAAGAVTRCVVSEYAIYA